MPIYRPIHLQAMALNEGGLHMNMRGAYPMHIFYKNKPCSQTNRTASDHGLTVHTCICIIYVIGLTCLLNPCLSSITKVLYTVHGRPIIEVNIAPIKENTAECVIC